MPVSPAPGSPLAALYARGSYLFGQKVSLAMSIADTKRELTVALTTIRDSGYTVPPVERLEDVLNWHKWDWGAKDNPLGLTKKWFDLISPGKVPLYHAQQQVATSFKSFKEESKALAELEQQLADVQAEIAKLNSPK